MNVGKGAASGRGSAGAPTASSPAGPNAADVPVGTVLPLDQYLAAQLDQLDDIDWEWSDQESGGSGGDDDDNGNDAKGEGAASGNDALAAGTDALAAGAGALATGATVNADVAIGWCMLYQNVLPYLCSPHFIVFSEFFGLPWTPPAIASACFSGHLVVLQTSADSAGQGAGSQVILNSLTPVIIALRTRPETQCLDSADLNAKAGDLLEASWTLISKTASGVAMVADEIKVYQCSQALCDWLEPSWTRGGSKCLEDCAGNWRSPDDPADVIVAAAAAAAAASGEAEGGVGTAKITAADWAQTAASAGAWAAFRGVHEWGGTGSTALWAQQNLQGSYPFRLLLARGFQDRNNVTLRTAWSFIAGHLSFLQYFASYRGQIDVWERIRALRVEAGNVTQACSRSGPLPCAFLESQAGAVLRDAWTLISRNAAGWTSDEEERALAASSQAFYAWLQKPLQKRTAHRKKRRSDGGAQA